MNSPLTSKEIEEIAFAIKAEQKKIQSKSKQTNIFEQERKFNFWLNSKLNQNQAKTIHDLWVNKFYKAKE